MLIPCRKQKGSSLVMINVMITKKKISSLLKMPEKPLVKGKLWYTTVGGKPTPTKRVLKKIILGE